MNKKKQSEGLVYSTDHGRMCPKCDSSIDSCRCSNEKTPPKGDGIIRISRSTKGRKGKGVTVLSGFSLSSSELTDLSKDLKRFCGTGGTVKNFTIEIQGDHREKLLAEMKKRGFQAKIAGG